MKDILKKAGAICTLVAASMMPMQAQAEGPEISGDVSATIASNYVTPDGAILGPESFQTLVNLYVGDNLSFFVFDQFNLETNKHDEVDVGVWAGMNLTEKLSGHVLAMVWDFPSGALGDRDYVICAGLQYDAGLGNVKLDATHLLNWGGTSYVLGFNKTLPEVQLPHGKSITFTPKAEVSYVGKDFYQDVNDWGVARIGIDMELDLNSVSVIAALNKQVALSDTHKSQLYGSVGVKKSF